MEQVALNELNSKVDYLTRLVEMSLNNQDDSFMDEEDRAAIIAGRLDYAAGKGISLEQLREELGYVRD